MYPSYYVSRDVVIVLNYEKWHDNLYRISERQWLADVMRDDRDYTNRD